MPESEAVNIIHAAGAPEIEAVQTLWSEYWDLLGFSPGFQGFAEERAHLPGKYASPRGRLLLACAQNGPAGTAAFRPLDDRSCEAKRFYVRPAHQGKGVGRALLARLIEEARGAGYEMMYGDTHANLLRALRLYHQAGFVEVGPYSPDPTPGAVYLKLVL